MQKQNLTSYPEENFLYIGIVKKGSYDSSRKNCK